MDELIVRDHDSSGWVDIIIMSTMTCQEYGEAFGAYQSLEASASARDERVCSVKPECCGRSPSVAASVSYLTTELNGGV